MAYIKLTTAERQEIARLAVTTRMQHQEIAAQFGISGSRVGQIVKQFAPTVDSAENDAIYDAVKNATGRNILSKEWRFQQYERDLNKLDQQYTSDAVNVRTRILAEVAKEVGDIAPSQHHYTAEVSHIIGVDMQRFLSASTVPALTASDIVDAEVIDG